MIEAFKAYNRENKLYTENDRVLVAVSGGIDSVCMLDLLISIGIRCGITHCNFKLRGTESDEDEAFVATLSKKYDIPFHNTSFETTEYALEKGVSIQMAARDLRYQWFEETRQAHGYNLVAIAHNKNDVAETVLINLCRGTGIKGLAGINPKNGFVVRPLLFASREMISLYAQDHKISFREDSSNNSVKYKRNKIRHEIIPVFEELNPSFVDTIAETADRARDLGNMLVGEIQSLKTGIISGNDDETRVDIKKLLDCPFRKTLLFELLSDYGFSSATVAQINQSLEGEPGKVFYSGDYKLIKDREQLLIVKNETHDQSPVNIKGFSFSISSPLQLASRVYPKGQDFKIDPSGECAQFDADKMTTPLEIRRWRAGDFFFPLGMKGRKKLSDYFTHQKFSLVDKEKVWVLCSGADICWIIGHQIDDRFKVEPGTKNILEITYKP